MGISPTIHYGPNPSYDSMPITPKTWKEVDLTYFSVINGKRYQNTVDLLRPITWLHKHGMDKVGNTITLSLLKFGINRVKAYVVAIKPTMLDTRGMNWSKRGFRPVIGKFKRYALDVRTYTFRDSKGHIDHIHATPNHPFYVKNKHGFVAIEDVKDTDVLLGMNDGIGLSGNEQNGTGNYDDTGHRDRNKDVSSERYGRLDHDAKSHDHLDDVVHLVCDKGMHSHCGKTYSDGEHPVAVYNLEIYRKHVFRVGVQGVVVHNYCTENDHKETLSKYISLLEDTHQRFYSYYSDSHNKEEEIGQIYQNLLNLKQLQDYLLENNVLQQELVLLRIKIQDAYKDNLQSWEYNRLTYGDRDYINLFINNSRIINKYSIRQVLKNPFYLDIFKPSAPQSHMPVIKWLFNDCPVTQSLYTIMEDEE